MTGDGAATQDVFHVELKQGFNSVRRFNLPRVQLEAQILRPWLAGREIELDDRKYVRQNARLRVLRGPVIATEEMGLGRGWANAERAGTYVTDDVLAAAEQTPPVAAGADGGIESFKSQVLAVASEQPVTLAAVAAMAGSVNPRWRVSEQLALAERAVWELLHQHKLVLYTPADLGAAAPERWQPVLLAWASWGGEVAAGYTVQAARTG